MLDGSVDIHKVNGFLGAFLQENAENLYRCKGLFAVDGHPDRHVFQASWIFSVAHQDIDDDDDSLSNNNTCIAHVTREYTYTL